VRRGELLDARDHAVLGDRARRGSSLAAPRSIRSTARVAGELACWRCGQTTATQATEAAGAADRRPGAAPQDEEAFRAYDARHHWFIEGGFAESSWTSCPGRRRICTTPAPLESPGEIAIESRATRQRWREWWKCVKLGREAEGLDLLRTPASSASASGRTYRKGPGRPGSSTKPC